jgi:hypothetical protein
MDGWRDKDFVDFAMSIGDIDQHPSIISTSIHPSLSHLYHHRSSSSSIVIISSLPLPLQAANNPVGYKGVTDCFVRILKEEGVGTFYRCYIDDYDYDYYEG